ncbi:MAG TPA: MSHA biogenesis protein MshP [Cellvibrio sp.]|nr:MSHA biogenesis protein MshP [Cellvibrio sp.]
MTISRTSTQTQISGVQELTNVQSFYAAESGAQRGMQRLFLSNTTRNATDAACAAMAINHNFANINGLKICTATVTCTCRYRDNTLCNAGAAANYVASASQGVTKSFYTITSVGACGQEYFRSVRTIQVGAYLDQE